MTLNPKSSRVLELYQLFQSGASINKQEFAERYGINVRSVQRDIDTIRDFLANQSRNHGSIQSINYDKSSNSYKLVSQNINYLSNGEMLALCKILIESRAFTKEKLTSLLNNILSNSIESVREIIDKDKRVIGLNIYQQNKDLIIEEYNYYQNDRRINADGLITTNKQDSHNHGLGLRSIRYIVNYYNGTLKLSLEEKEKMFFLKIVIPIKKLPSNNEK